MFPTKTSVEEFYDAYVEREWDRMDRHRMEFRTTLRAMSEYIPAGSRILDVGGGPGRYSIELARQGHRVTLLDLSAANIEFARTKSQDMGVVLDGYHHGNALDLSAFERDSFDVVLLMGPLYHLVSPEERSTAVREATRVLRHGGLLFASFVTRYAPVYDIFRHYPEEIERREANMRAILSHGLNIPSDGNPGFTLAYFNHPLEIEPFMEESGLKKLRLAVAEGLIAAVEPIINTLEAQAFERWVDICYTYGTDPVVWGAGEHMLYVGQK